MREKVKGWREGGKIKAGREGGREVGREAVREGRREGGGEGGRELPLMLSINVGRTHSINVGRTHIFECNECFPDDFWEDSLHFENRVLKENERPMTSQVTRYHRA